MRQPSASKLARDLSRVQKLNNELKDSIELKGKSLNNSLSSLFAGTESLSPLGSFSNIAQYNVYAPLTINYIELTFMYKTHGLLQTAVDMPVLDAFRGGIDPVDDQLSPDDLAQLKDALEKTGLVSVLTEAGSWARLYGGGAVIINTDQDPAKPLQIKPNMKLDFYAANRWEIQSPNRFSETYNFYGKTIHHSRVLTIPGKAAPYLVKFVLQGWGMSELERMIPPLNIYLRTQDVIYELLREAKIDVFRFENFTSSLATEQGTQQVLRRLSLMNRAKQFNNAIALDVKDEFEQKQITFAGLAEVHKQNMIYIASALRMPMTKLFGLSAAGFNSGEDDIENYNAMIESEVRQPLRPVIREVLKLLCASLFGLEAEIDFNYKPLRVLGEVEEETVKTQKYARFKSMFDDGILDPKQYAELLHTEKLVPVEPAAAKGGLLERPHAADEAGELGIDEEGKPETKDDED